MLPLEGIRILALTHYAAGPYGAMHLADLGADVINIEDPVTGGDLARHVPPFGGAGDSLFYQSLNRNKRSVALNLRTDEGKRLFHRLVATSDVVFNNLRGDQPAKLGLTYEALKTYNPQVVCVSLSGFGTTGPRVKEPTFDYLIQALTGVMELTGSPDGPPERAGVSFVDFSTGAMGALCAMVGLWQAKRQGYGLDVETSMLETGLSYMNYVAAYWLNAGMLVTRMEQSAHPTVAPSRRFATADGHIMLMAQTDKFWELLCGRLERTELLTDPRFVTADLRFSNRAELEAELAPLIATRPTAYWVEHLAAHVPCAPVQTIAEGLRDPQVVARGALLDIDDQLRGPQTFVGCPIRVSGAEATPKRPAPLLGADTGAVLADVLGLTEDEVRSLQACGAIAGGGA